MGNENEEADNLLIRSMSGETLTTADDMTILQDRGATLTRILAGAHSLRKRSFGERVELC